MQETTNILQRMRELALQAANGSNSDDDRTALNKEVTALKDELTRIANTTSFGTTKLLDGTYGTSGKSTFQIGAQKGETVELELKSTKASDLGSVAGLNTTGSAGTYTIANLGKAAETVTIAGSNTNGSFSVDVEIEKGAGITDIVEAVNSAAGSYGVYATQTAAGAFEFQVDKSLIASGTFTTTGSVASDGGFFKSTTATVTVGTTDVTISGAVDGVSVGSQTDAQNALAVIDSAITEVDGRRADLGAFQNRLESTISNLRNISENVSAARSRILDADFASETANLTRIQILQQAGTAILAQANAAPQSVLSLLQ